MYVYEVLVEELHRGPGPNTMTKKDLVMPVCGHRLFQADCPDCQKVWDDHTEPMTDADKDILRILEKQYQDAMGNKTLQDSFEYYYGKTYITLKRREDMEKLS